MIYGYARCSTNEKMQDINRQVRELKQMGVTNESMYLEYESGTITNRVQLNRLLECVEQGDTIIATEVSRITRSSKQLCDIIEFAKQKHIKLIFGTFTVDCTNELDPMTEGMIKMMGVFAELERNIISQRVKSGMENARAKGKVIGRHKTTKDNLPKIFIKNYEKYKNGQITKMDLSRLSEISYPTVYKYINIMEA
ncbi:MAG: recombinase family protein [Lachnospiraceae bacterium]|nr:recombinase family protein [Lachnospiraceae bacterium]